MCYNPGMVKYVMTIAMVLGLVCACPQSAYGQDSWTSVAGELSEAGSALHGKSGFLNKATDTQTKTGDKAAKVEEKAKDKARKPGKNAVVTALEEAGYFSRKKAKPTAEYYIFICSASWCPPCRKLMPHIVKEYKSNIRRNPKVDLILLGGDKDEDECKKYLKHYRADFPGLHARKQINLPDFPQIQYWPFAIFVDADGKVITSGHGQMVLEWKEHLSL